MKVKSSRIYANIERVLNYVFIDVRAKTFASLLRFYYFVRSLPQTSLEIQNVIDINVRKAKINWIFERDFVNLHECKIRSHLKIRVEAAYVISLIN